jgi:hypothetical protein
MGQCKPRNLPPNEARRRLRRVERLAWWLDAAMRIPGTRFRIGLDALIGLIPGLGDVLTAALAAVIVVEARRLGVRGPVLVRMLLNIALDVLIGLLPIVGDVGDACFKANRRNLRLLKRAMHGDDASSR